MHYIPGWDCHGLPIEWKVEEKFRKAGKNKDEINIKDLEECRNFAAKWVNIQDPNLQDLVLVLIGRKFD